MELVAFVVLVINGSLMQLPITSIPTIITVPIDGCAELEAMVDPSSTLGIQVLGDVEYLGYPSPKYLRVLACGGVKLRIDKWRPLGHKLRLSIKRAETAFAGDARIRLNGSAAIIKVKSVGPVGVKGDFAYIVDRSNNSVVVIAYGDYVELRGVGIAEVTLLKFGDDGVWLSLPWLGVRLSGRYITELREIPTFSPNQTVYLDEPAVEWYDVELGADGCVTRVVLRNKTVIIVTREGAGSIRLDAAPLAPINVTGREVTRLVLHLADGGVARLEDFQIIDEYGNSMGRCVPSLMKKVLVRFEVGGREYVYAGEVSGNLVHVYARLIDASISVVSPIKAEYYPARVLAEIGDEVTVTILLNGRVVGRVNITVTGPNIIIDASQLYSRYRLVDILGVELVGDAKVYTVYGVFNASEGYVILPRGLSGELSVEYLGAKFSAVMLGNDIVVETLSAKTIVELSAVSALASLIIQSLGFRRVTSGDTADR